MHYFMSHVYKQRHTWSLSLLFSVLSSLLLLLAACGGSGATVSSSHNAKPAARQILKFPDVGTNDVATLDPAMDPDTNSAIPVGMLYTGLVKTDQALNVIPDQATWQISSDNKVYTFAINPAAAFSDGTPVTAQAYISTWTRALLPSLGSPLAATLEAPIVGASSVAAGKSTTLSGLKAVNEHTLQVTLTQPTAYFLTELTNSLFFPLNQKVIARYGQKNWTLHAAMSGVGAGPFQLKEWDHNIKMVFTPNPYYYGNKTRLTEVDMLFVNDQGDAYTAYRAGQYDFVWNLKPDDQAAAKTSSGFTRAPLLQTDALFFDTTRAPFNKQAVRQAFAQAVDKGYLVTTAFDNSVLPAQTILPPGMPGYQGGYVGLQFDKYKAKTLLQSVYPDLSKVPLVTFSYPSSLVSAGEASLLQQMWEQFLGIPIQLRAIEADAYFDEEQKGQISFGFTQWSADFPDPYNLLAQNLLSTASANNGLWRNTNFDQTVMQAEKLSGDARIALYQKAEQIAIADVGWLPLDHQTLTAVIPANVHGVTLNGNGLYFGDWSGVYLS